MRFEFEVLGEPDLLNQSTGTSEPRELWDPKDGNFCFSGGGVLNTQEVSTLNLLSRISLLRESWWHPGIKYCLIPIEDCSHVPQMSGLLAASTAHLLLAPAEYMTRNTSAIHSNYYKHLHGIAWLRLGTWYVSGRQQLVVMQCSYTSLRQHWDYVQSPQVQRTRTAANWDCLRANSHSGRPFGLTIVPTILTKASATESIFHLQVVKAM